MVTILKFQNKRTQERKPSITLRVHKSGRIDSNITGTDLQHQRESLASAIDAAKAEIIRRLQGR